MVVPKKGHNLSGIVCKIIDIFPGRYLIDPNRHIVDRTLIPEDELESLETAKLEWFGEQLHNPEFRKKCMVVVE